MTRAKSMYLALLAVLLSPIAVNADPIRLDAASNIPGIPDWYIIFDDTGDGLLQWNEIVEFSGFVLDTDIFEFVLRVPDIAGISTLSSDPTFGTAGPNAWFFRNPTSGGLALCEPGICWSETLSLVAVPEPGTLALLSIGLFGMGLSRRRKKARPRY